MNPTQTWAQEYELRGYALARIKPGQKRPTDPGWTEFSFPADQFTGRDNVGLQSGGRSNDLVCVDLDAPEAVDQADRFLPPPTWSTAGPPSRGRTAGSS